MTSSSLYNPLCTHILLQVVDPNPVPGLNVSPVQGVVPVGGTTELKIHLTPSAVMKFDTRLEVAIRGWKTIELRMGGTVEPPLVDINVVSNFIFIPVLGRCPHIITCPCEL